jgi:hypothetical protein
MPVVEPHTLPSGMPSDVPGPSPGVFLADASHSLPAVAPRPVPSIMPAYAPGPIPHVLLADASHDMQIVAPIPSVLPSVSQVFSPRESIAPYEFPPPSAVHPVAPTLFPGVMPSMEPTSYAATSPNLSIATSEVPLQYANTQDSCLYRTQPDTSDARFDLDRLIQGSIQTYESSSMLGEFVAQ